MAAENSLAEKRSGGTGFDYLPRLGGNISAPCYGGKSGFSRRDVLALQIEFKTDLSLDDEDIYKEVEAGIARVVAEVFGLTWPAPPEVKKADLAVLSAERKQGLLPSYGPWYKNFPLPADIHIEEMSWVQVKELFSSELNFLLTNRPK